MLKPGEGLQPLPAKVQPATLGPDSEVEVSEARVIRIDGKPIGPPLD